VFTFFAKKLKKLVFSVVAKFATTATMKKFYLLKMVWLKYLE